MLFLTLMLLTSCGLSIDKKGLNDVMKNEIKFDQLVKDLVTLEGSEFSEQAKKSLDLWIDAAIDFSNMTIELVKDSKSEQAEALNPKITSHPYVKISYAIEKKLEDIYGGKSRDIEFRNSFRDINQNRWAWAHRGFNSFFLTMIQSPAAGLMEKLDKELYKNKARRPERIVTPLFAYILCLCRQNVNIKFLNVFKLERLAEQESQEALAMLEYNKKGKEEEQDATMYFALAKANLNLWNEFRMTRIIIQIIKDYQEGKGNQIGEKVVPSFTAETKKAKKLMLDTIRKAGISQTDLEEVMQDETEKLNDMAKLIKELVEFLTKQEEKEEFDKSRELRDSRTIAYSG